MTIVIPQSGAEVVVTPGTLESVGTPWRQLPCASHYGRS